MSPLCARTRTLLPGYGREALAAEERRALRAHLSACAACRREALELDPTLLFAMTPPSEVAAEEIAAVVAGVRAGVLLKRAERRVAPAPRRWRARLAAAAAVALFTLLLPGGLRPREASEPRTAAGAASGFAPAGRPEVVEKTPGGATIYDWNPGGGEPRVVWIVDRSLDI